MYYTSKEQLALVPTPEQTATYKPVLHTELADITLNALDKAGFVLQSEEYTSSSNGRVANGLYTISNIQDNEMQVQIAWQNSYDKTLALKFAIGTRIFICSNGCVSGDMGAFRKKHVGDVQVFTPQSIAEYIKQSGDVFTRIQKDRDVMKDIRVSRRTSAELIGRMMIEESIIASTQLNIIKRELEKPTFDYGAPDSLWELYQHATFSMKTLNPSNWMSNHIKAHEFFRGAVEEVSLYELN